jgi:hypothetical protein
MSCRTQFRRTLHANAFRSERAALNTFIARPLDSQEAAELYVADRDEESVSIATAHKTTASPLEVNTTTPLR